MLLRLVCCLIPLLALLVVALPASLIAPALRDIPLLLSALTLGLLAGGRLPLFAAMLLGLGLDILLHLPLGAYSLPFLLLTLLLSGFREPLLRQPLWQWLPLTALGLLGFSAAQGAWLETLGQPALTLVWYPPLIAVVLWLPLLLVAQSEYTEL